MKTKFTYFDGTKVTIKSKNKDLVNELEQEAKNRIEKSNRIEKIERIERIDL